MIIASLPVASAEAQDLGSTWVLVWISLAQFLMTVLVIVWRVSAMLKSESNTHAAAMAKHELDDATAFARITATITAGDDKLREEIASIATALRASVMSAQADLANRINQVELHTERTFLSKDSFYAALTEMKNSNKEDFAEIKEWLKRLEEKFDER